MAHVETPVHKFAIRVRTLCAAGFVFAMLPSLSWAGDCNLSIGAINLCKRCTTIGQASTSRDTACTGYPPRGTYANTTAPIMLEGRISKQAANGRAVMSGASWTYTPKKGFTGRDSFTIERSGIQNEQLYVFYIQIDMDVRP